MLGFSNIVKYHKMYGQSLVFKLLSHIITKYMTLYEHFRADL